MNNKTLIIYYIYVLLVLAVFSYAVFVLDHSGWWFILALLFIEISPKNDK